MCHVYYFYLLLVYSHLAVETHRCTPRHTETSLLALFTTVDRQINFNNVPEFPLPELTDYSVPQLFVIHDGKRHYQHINSENIINKTNIFKLHWDLLMSM